MAGEIGKGAAEELKGKLDVDEQRKQQGLDDATFDEQVLKHLREKLAPEIEAFNGQAQAADLLKLEKGSSMMQFFKDNKPAFAILVQHRKLLFLDPKSTTPSQTLTVAGGPEEYMYSGGMGGAAPIDEDDLLKGILRVAVGSTFEAK